MTVSSGSISGSEQSAQNATILAAALVAPNLRDRLVLSGNLIGSGTVTKLGAGTVVLFGNNSGEMTESVQDRIIGRVA